MGFLDGLLKSQVRKVVSNAVDNAVDNWMGNNNNNQNATVTQSAAANPDEADCCYNEAVVRSRIERIAAEEWPGYVLYQNISPTLIGGPVEARSYTYGLYSNGVPKAMIIVLDKPSHYHKKDVVLAHDACRRQGIFCMNLMLHLPNRRSYISERLRSNIKAY